MSATLDRKLRQATAALAAGDAAAAERLSREILDQAPRHPRALHLAAVARLEQGDGAGAGALLRRVLESDPHNLQAMEDLGSAELKAGAFAEAESWLRRAIGRGRRGAGILTWLGIALASQGRHAEAVAAFREAAGADPASPGAHLNLGNELMQVGAPEEAIASYERALGLQPAYPEALNRLGSALKERGSHDDAAARFREAIALRPDYAEAHDNLGAALLRLGRATDAAASFRQAILLQPDSADYHSDLGHALRDQERWDEAITQYERALAIEPGFVEAMISLASALQGRGSLDEAAGRARQAIALRPDFAEAHDSLGQALLRMGRADEANACFRRAITLRPDAAALRLSFGGALQEQHLWDDAVAQFERALELDRATEAEVQFRLSLVSLFRRDFARAWPGYERRLEAREFRTKKFREDASNMALLFERLPRWRGPGESGVREVAIWAEQGIGDEVLYSTLIPELARTGPTFLYEVDRRLQGACQRAFPAVRFVAKAAWPHESLQQASRVLLAGSLPGLFRRSQEDFARQPAKLLSALPDRVAHYRGELGASGLKVALSWRSTRQDHWGSRKTVTLASLSPLLRLPGTQFVDVQYGDTASERGAVEAATGVRLRHFDEVDYFNDLEEVLAILESCDLVITTSNATAHFAGALGKRTWLLYPADQAPFHYWAHGESHRSLWYPSVEIVTARALADWATLIAHAAEKLRHCRAGS